MRHLLKCHRKSHGLYSWKCQFLRYSPHIWCASTPTHPLSFATLTDTHIWKEREILNFNRVHVRTDTLVMSPSLPPTTLKNGSDRAIDRLVLTTFQSSLSESSLIGPRQVNSDNFQVLIVRMFPYSKNFKDRLILENFPVRIVRKFPYSKNVNQTHTDYIHENVSF